MNNPTDPTKKLLNPEDNTTDDNSQPASIVGSVPIRLPRNAVQNSHEGIDYKYATNALAEIPVPLSSSLGKSPITIQNLGTKRISIDSFSNQKVEPVNSYQDPSTNIIGSKVNKGKMRVSFKPNPENFDSQSEVSGSYEVNKRDAARMLKRHLITTTTQVKVPSRSDVISSSYTGNTGSSALSRSLLSENFVSSDDNSKSNLSKKSKNNAIGRLDSAKSSAIKNKHKKPKTRKEPKTIESEQDEYDSLLESEMDQEDVNITGKYNKAVLKNQNDIIRSDNANVFSREDTSRSHSENETDPNLKTHKALIDPLTLPSGDITHFIYKWQAANAGENSTNLKRIKSYSAVKKIQASSNQEWDIPFEHGEINQPGGFRRYFVRQRAINEGRNPPSQMTAGFVDFISLYGHFAGGNYPSDEDEASSGDEFYEDEERYLEYLNRERLRRSSGVYGSIDGMDRQQPAASHPEGTASSKKAFFLLIKAFVGTGVLFLPKSFYNGGLLFSIVLMAVMAYLALHCMLLLVECHSKFKMSYGDIGYKLMGESARQVVLASIVLSQIGFCCAYAIFIATNTRSLFNAFTNCSMNFPLSFWILVQFVAYIPMSMVRKIKNFSILALIADAFIVVGLVYLLYYDGSVLASKGIAEIQMFNPKTFPLLVGTAVFSFEGIGLVIPVVDSMKKPSEFPRVLSLTVFVSAAIFISVAAISYMAFGKDVETVILVNMTSGGVYTQSVQLLYSLAILFSVPLQLFPAIRILEAGLFTRSGKRNQMVKWQKNVFRLGLCLIVAFISIFVADQLDEFVSMIGSFACVPLSFIYPSIFHYKAIATTRWTKIKDLALFFVGIFTMFYVTNLTFQHWGSSKPPLDQCPTPLF
ncbi:hypothetical protein BB559_001959 [Furculomyces boomerangus]|uniref:Amino acid transporter transmembrane domain-containing protein n=1 Tax=Furculomyces boomerangus TaxID=61424 RepID=A0A2T9YZ41_9FUNG|nr:hypothetical protein BB559_001959 [Furculomyces boomerangus]